jgi:DNA-binding transcriptional MerR regulator
MRIGLLAARAGVSASRIRFYEARGLLPPSTKTSQRLSRL